MKLPHNITAEQMRAAKVGDVFVLDGHRASVSAVPFRGGFKFTTNMGFMTFKPSMPVFKVTVIEITGLPKGETK